ncbi:MAG: glutamate 5-kinase [Gemmatimonadaceae bacterium]|nr:glutamate 5-kinase [Gemmatimonadaceae bacterium]
MTRAGNAPTRTETTAGRHAGDEIASRAAPARDGAARARVAAARRIVIKIGTNVVVGDDGGIALGRLYGLLDAIVTLVRGGRRVVLVSSGAVGLGRDRLRRAAPEPAALARRTCAAIGQSRLIALYNDVFERLGVVAAQVLVTRDDVADPLRAGRLGATLATLLDVGAVPVVNENDVVAPLDAPEPAPHDAPLARSFGDNDTLAALVATAIGADALVLLSDVDGLYTRHPAHAPDAELIPVVPRVTAHLVASTDHGTVRGRGGMRSKLVAARLATSAGAHVVIANGRAPGVIDRVCAGEAVGTLFLPEEAP